MVELRWFTHADVPVIGSDQKAAGITVLQYRTLGDPYTSIDDDGTQWRKRDWSAWKDVPSVKGE